MKTLQEIATEAAIAATQNSFGNTKPYLTDIVSRFTRSPKNTELMAEVYLKRGLSYTDPFWAETYTKWLAEGNEAIGLNKLQLYSKWYFEKMRTKDGGGMQKK